MPYRLLNLCKNLSYLKDENKLSGQLGWKYFFTVLCINPRLLSFCTRLVYQIHGIYGLENAILIQLEIIDS